MQCYTLLIESQNPCDNLYLSHNKNVASLTSFYKYDGLVRELVLRCKLHEEWSAMNLIYRLLELDDRLPGLLDNVDSVASVPISLWSRLRNKYDLPGYLADMISINFGLKRVHVPMFLSLNLSKTSRVPKRTRRKSSKNCILEFNGEGVVAVVEGCLLIDDIVTTGSTLSRILEHSNDIHCSKILTFATAYQKDTSDDGYI